MINPCLVKFFSGPYYIYIYIPLSLPLERVSTGLNVFRQVQTCSNGSGQIWTGSDGFQRVGPALNTDTTRMFLDDVSGLFR